MGSFSAGALANIQEAARRVGINKDRIQDILQNAPAADGIVWNDGSLGSNITSVIREAFRQRGLYREDADRFIAAITALDTGIVGTITVPDLEDLRWTAAIQALVNAGFVTGTITGDSSDNAGAWAIGTVTDTQSPVATTTKTDLADNEVDFTVQGVPAVNDATLLAALTNLEEVGLVVAGIGDAIDCTVVVSTDVITSVGHGLSDGDRVLISAIATATGFTAGDIVYVHSSDDDTFEVETIIGADDGDFGGSDGTLSVRLIDSASVTYVDPDTAAVDDAIATVPAAGSYELDDGDEVSISLGGATVPTWSSGGAGDDGAMTPAEFATALGTAELSADGTSAGTGTLGAILSSDPAEGEFVAKGSVVTYTYNDPA